MSDNMKRQPAGIPVGGQFAANDHDEAASALAGGSAAEAQFSIAGRDYTVVKNMDGYSVMQGDVQVATFESDSKYEDDIEDEARDALREARGENLDSAERLELGVGVVTIRLDAGADSDEIARTLEKIAEDIEMGNTSGHYPTWSVGKDKDEGTAGTHTISITLDGNRAHHTLGEVQRWVEDGNTSGYYPSWEIEKTEGNTSEHAEHVAALFTHSSVEETGDGTVVVVNDPDEDTVYVISVDPDGGTSSATIDKNAYLEDPEAAMREADWDTGYEA